MQIFNSLKRKWENEIERGRLVDIAQVYFVAFVWIALFVLLFSTQGCAPKEDYKSEIPLSTEIVPGAKANAYSVRLSWNTELHPQLWLIHRKVEGAIGGSEEIASLPSDSRTVVDKAVESGKRYVYFLGAVTDPHYLLKSKTTVEIPSDLEVKGATKAFTPLKLNRLIFLKDGRLQTDGKDIEINANEIISDEGAIESFSEESQALTGNIGRGGGLISIKAKKGSGTLFVYGRGENGGVGVEGLPGSKGKPGEQGKDALGTHEHTNVVCSCGGIAEQLLRKIKYGNIVEVPLAFQEFAFRKLRHRCISEPTDGKVGGQGSAGSNGGEGGRGGDSAQILVEIEDPSAIQIRAYPSPGEGGAGGSGGRGGDGGQGGAPGSHRLDFFSNCRESAAGPEGARGDRGEAGQKGLKGSLLPMCIKLGTTSFGDCEKFNSIKGGN